MEYNSEILKHKIFLHEVSVSDDQSARKGAHILTGLSKKYSGTLLCVPGSLESTASDLTLLLNTVRVTFHLASDLPLLFQRRALFSREAYSVHSSI